MRTFSNLITLSVAAAVSNAIKVAVLSDMHLQPFYNPNVNASQFC